MTRESRGRSRCGDGDRAVSAPLLLYSPVTCAGLTAAPVDTIEPTCGSRHSTRFRVRCATGGPVQHGPEWAGKKNWKSSNLILAALYRFLAWPSSAATIASCWPMMRARRPTISRWPRN